MSFNKLRSPIVVIGMHRSGSTLLTKLLEADGVFWGREVDIYNEAKCFQRCNEYLLNVAGATWDNPEALFQFLKDDQQLRYSLDNLRELLNLTFMKSYLGEDRACMGSRRWGWKDPRNTFTIPVWSKIFPSMQVIHIIRNGIDVAASLWRREIRRPRTGDPHYSKICQNLHPCFDLWKTYVLTAQRNMKEVRRVIQIHFEDLIQHPTKTIGLIGDFLDLKPIFSMNRVLNTIDPAKCFAFKKDKALTKFRCFVENDALHEQLGYKFQWS